MGRQIILQPDGKLAVWSSIVDNFILFNATEDEILADDVAEFVLERVARIRKKVADLRSENPTRTGPFTITWEEAIETIVNVHGMSDQHEFLDKWKKTKEGD